MNHGSPYPLQNDRLLVEACLYQGDRAEASWEAWKNNVDFETEVDGSAFRLLPLLYFHLLQLGVEDPLMARLKGIYRRSWSNNHLLFLRAGQIINLLDEKNIPVLVLKGIPLTVLAYGNFGVRPMHDIDILIKKTHLTSVLAVLLQDGFALNPGQSLRYIEKFGNSVSLTDATGVELDLHWNPIVESNNSKVEHDWWADRVPLEVGGRHTWSMSNVNMLLHTLVHGIRYNPEPPIRWIPDSAVLINKGIDWTSFAHQARALKVGYTVMKGLNYLKTSFGVDIPASAIHDLNHQRYSLNERWGYKYAVSVKNFPPKTWSEKIVSNYFFYLRQTRFDNLLLQLAGFLKYSFFSFRSKSVLVSSLHHLYTRFTHQNRS